MGKSALPDLTIVDFQSLDTFDDRSKSQYINDPHLFAISYLSILSYNPERLGVWGKMTDCTEFQRSERGDEMTDSMRMNDNNENA